MRPLTTTTKKPFWRNLFQSIHDNDEGAATLETILIVAAIAIPLLIWIMKFGWPQIRGYFEEGFETLNQATDNAISNQ